jgi:hypothetical protein
VTIRKDCPRWDMVFRCSARAATTKNAAWVLLKERLSQGLPISPIHGRQRNLQIFE